MAKFEIPYTRKWKNPDYVPAGRRTFKPGLSRPVVAADGSVGEVCDEIETTSGTPAEEYLYDRPDVQVTCSECGASFSWQDLESDCTITSDDGDEAYSDSICPKCGAWNCCEIAFVT